MTNHMTSKRLLLIVCLSLLLLTLISCNLGKSLGELVEDVAARGTGLTSSEERATDVAEDAWREEEATLIAEVATHEAKATGTAEAEEAEEPAPIEECSAPGAWCVVEARFDFGAAYPEGSFERNEVNISFPVDGGAVSGNFHLERRVEHVWEDGECVELHKYHGTLSGHFDPVSRKLEGAVHDSSPSWEELEGCEDFETESIGGDATSWWATYNPTTGELQGIVKWETDDEEWPFHN